MLTHFALLISESSFWISIAYISGLTPANFVVIFQPIFFLLAVVKIITWYIISFLKQSFDLLSIYKNHWFTLFLLIHNDTDCIHEQNFNIFFFPLWNHVIIDRLIITACSDPELIDQYVFGQFMSILFFVLSIFWKLSEICLTPLNLNEEAN